MIRFWRHSRADFSDEAFYVTRNNSYFMIVMRLCGCSMMFIIGRGYIYILHLSASMRSCVGEVHGCLIVIG